MSTITEFSDYELTDTMEDYLEKRIIAAFATDATLEKLLFEANKFGWTQGEPPLGKLLDTPGGYVWIIRERPSFNAQGSMMEHEYEVAVRIALSNKVSYKPLPMNSDGTFKDWSDEKHTGLREIHAIRARLRYVLETVGFDNGWYYDFVTQGVLGERGRIEIRYDRFGGAETGSNLYVQYFTMIFTVLCWSESATTISKGSLAVTVSDGSVVSGATVWVKDHFGNTVLDSSGNDKWTTNGSGVATVTNAVAQKDVTIYSYESTHGTLSSASNNISNAASTSVTITYGTNAFEFTTSYANINDDPDWVLEGGTGNTSALAGYLTLTGPSSAIHAAVTSNVDQDYQVAIALNSVTGVDHILEIGTDSSGAETTGTLRMTISDAAMTIEEYDGSSWDTTGSYSAPSIPDYQEIVIERSATNGVKVTSGGTTYINATRNQTTAGEYMRLEAGTNDMIVNYIRITPLT